MSIVLVYPGQESTLLDLQEILKGRHDRHRKLVLDEVKRRTDGGIPLDDGDGPLRDPGEYSPRAQLDGIRVKLRVLSAKKIRHLNAAHASALERVLRASKSESRDADMAEAVDAVFDARAQYISASVVTIAGVFERDIDGKELDFNRYDALERNSLTTPIFEAAVEFQDLPAGKLSPSG
jgi:hypothetical protein